MIHTHILASLVLFLLVPSPFIASQTAAPSSLPSDPVALMLLAHEKNGLTSADVRPWHIRGTYSIFDMDGKPRTGIYEEWWVSAAKYKRSYTSGAVTRTDFSTGTELYRTGTKDWPSGVELLLRSSLIEPLPDNDVLKEFKPQLQVASAGKDKFNCVRLSYPLPANLTVSSDFFQTDCFDSKIPVLLISSKNGFQTTYNQLAVFQGHYLAKELQYSFRGQPRFELKLDVIESLREAPDELLTPPADSVAVNIGPAPIVLSKGESGLIKLKEVGPRYPEEALRLQIQGTVAMQVIVGKDGHIASVNVTSGPVQLRGDAVDAVKQWYYKPFTVAGEARDVQIDVTMHFNRR